eukprot:TRINITY_DN6110_c0_g4_i3.p1 TRINITY_DN6110_c0_g4~~TRINITY_DN6110_c0_g4_i3.p1  ORF type:complete len:113 (-),score=17.66 TRINITY_DN6110_c0_g4_i3:977-1315(-)
MMLMPESLEKLNGEATVESLIPSFLELTCIQPEMQDLRILMSRCVLDLENMSHNPGKTIEEIDQLVQASREEILLFLKHNNAFEYEGRWVLLNKTCENEILDLLITFVRAEG